jgi:DNA-binding transcriptional MerR regulator/effector-binding domain-containing protein
MTSGVSIGEFSRLCHLSAKTLRYYHDIALLVPAAVDEGTGYRRYSTAQVGDALLIRRLRDLDLPLTDVRAVVAESEGPSRNAILARHLDRMDVQLARTRDVVISLRRLLGTSPATEPDMPVTHRFAPASTALCTRARVARTEVGEWCRGAYPALYGSLAEHGVDPAGPAGATYAAEFFEQDVGEIVAFVPVPPESAVAGDPGHATLPARRFAVALHSGPFTDCDITYARLGSHVADHDVARADPIVEVYLIGPDHTTDADQYRTEICWPIH